MFFSRLFFRSRATVLPLNHSNAASRGSDVYFSNWDARVIPACQPLPANSFSHINVYIVNMYLTLERV